MFRGLRWAHNSAESHKYTECVQKFKTGTQHIQVSQMYNTGQPEVLDKLTTHHSLLNIQYVSRGLRQAHNSTESYKCTTRGPEVKYQHIFKWSLINVLYGSKGPEVEDKPTAHLSLIGS